MQRLKLYCFQMPKTNAELVGIIRDYVIEESNKSLGHSLESIQYTIFRKWFRRYVLITLIFGKEE